MDKKTLADNGFTSVENKNSGILKPLEGAGLKNSLPAKEADDRHLEINELTLLLSKMEVIDSLLVMKLSSMISVANFNSFKTLSPLIKVLIGKNLKPEYEALIRAALVSKPGSFEIFGSILSIPDGVTRDRLVDFHFSEIGKGASTSEAMAEYALQLLIINENSKALSVLDNLAYQDDSLVNFVKILGFYINGDISNGDALVENFSSLEPLKTSEIKTISFFARHKPITSLVKILIAKGCNNSVKNLLSILIDIYPLAPGYFNIGLLLDDSESACIFEVHFRKLTNLGKKNPLAIAMHALQLIQLRRARNAVELLVKSDSCQHPEVSYTLALAYFWIDDFHKSLEVLNSIDNTSALGEKYLSKLISLRMKLSVVLGDDAQIINLLNEYSELNIPKHERIYCNLSVGRYAEAFSEYFNQKSVPHLSLLSKNVLNESSVKDVLSKKIKTCAIVCEMGLGDEVRFSSLLPEIANFFEKTVIYCDPRLESVFSRSFDNVEVKGFDFKLLAALIKSHHKDEKVVIFEKELAKYDVLAELKQFSFILRSIPRSFPETGSYIKPRPDLLEKWVTFLRDLKKPVFGLFWGSRIISYDAQHKQTSLQYWIDRLPKDDVAIIPLQYDLTMNEDSLLDKDSRFVRVNGYIDLKNDLEEVFALLAALPLVVSTAGSTQHMAGSVGTKVFCPAHPFQAKWRTLHGKKRQEIWSPSVQIMSGSLEHGLTGSVDLCIDEIMKWIS